MQGLAWSDPVLPLFRSYKLEFDHPPLNFIGDQNIEAKLKICGRQLNGPKTAEDFKDETARQALRGAAEAIARQAAEIGDISAVTGEYKRRIQL